MSVMRTSLLDVECQHVWRRPAACADGSKPMAVQNDDASGACVQMEMSMLSAIQTGLSGGVTNS